VSAQPAWLLIVPPLLVLIGAMVGATAAIFGQLLTEGYKHYRDCQMTARGIAASIDATLIMTDRRGYVRMAENIIARINQGEQIKAEKIIEDAGIDPVTEKLLDRVGSLGHDLPVRIAIIMQVLTGIRLDFLCGSEGANLSKTCPPWRTSSVSTCFMERI
jgi:hypothetical protein